MPNLLTINATAGLVSKEIMGYAHVLFSNLHFALRSSSCVDEAPTEIDGISQFAVKIKIYQSLG